MATTGLLIFRRGRIASAAVGSEKRNQQIAIAIGASRGYTVGSGAMLIVERIDAPIAIPKYANMLRAIRIINFIFKCMRKVNHSR